MKIITTLAALLALAGCMSIEQQTEYELDRRSELARALWPGLKHVHDHELREEIRRCGVDFVAREGRDFERFEGIAVYKRCFIDREWLSADTKTQCAPGEAAAVCRQADERVAAKKGSPNAD